MTDPIDSVELAAELTAAWLANPNTRTSSEDVPAFLLAMHNAVTSLIGGGGGDEQADETAKHEPAVSVRKSLASPDHIISMIDGKPYRTLRRHLSTRGLTPDQYRERYNLRPDYPMVASSYSEARRTMAKTIGLGRKPGTRIEKKGEAGSPTKARKTKAAPAATSAPEADG